jgi:hypothetical protein
MKERGGVYVKIPNSVNLLMSTMQSFSGQPLQYPLSNRKNSAEIQSKIDVKIGANYSFFV